MFRNYLKIAIKVLLRRKFFTVVSLFGISFTLVVLMVATAVLDHVIAPMPPEVDQDRTVSIMRASMYGENSQWNGGAGFRLLDRYARDLPGAERMSIFTSPEQVYSYPSGTKVGVALKRTDGEFWQILRFDFIEGCAVHRRRRGGGAASRGDHADDEGAAAWRPVGGGPDRRGRRPAFPRRRRG